MRTRRLVLSTLASALLAGGAVALVPSPAQALAGVVINEVESQDPSGGSDWVELYNNSAAAVGVGSWQVKESGGNTVTVLAGTTLQPNTYLTVDISGLGNPETVQLLNDSAVQIDSFAYADHAIGTWSRCPDGADNFDAAKPTKGFANACVVGAAWPGGTGVTDADNGAFGTNLSGLAYEASGSAAPGTVWAVKNDPGTLYRVTKSGGVWSPAATWDLNYLGGLGNPDAEGVTLTSAGPAGGVYVATERDGGGGSRPAVERYVPSGNGGPLDATNDWDLTADLSGLGANAGLEAIAWVPDTYLTDKGFKTTGGTAYNPADYANHGTGLFFVGVEQDGAIVAYALNHATNAFTRVATVTNVFPSVMDLGFDPDLQQLWVVCDDSCKGRTALYGVSTAAGPDQGKFVADAIYERPTGMPNLNNEGFTVAPSAECASGLKPVFWSDDSNTGGHALRAGTISCSGGGGGTGPTISGAATSSKAKTAAGWYAAPVTVTFTCAAGSAPLSGGCPAAVTLSTSGADQSVSRSVTDTNGQSAQATVSNIDIDLAGPTVKITGVKKGKTYAAKKKPKCKASDALSGLDSCKVKQKKKGSKYIVTATATDKAGNVTTAKLTYKVKPKNP